MSGITQADWTLAAKVMGFDSTEALRRHGHLRALHKQWAERLAAHRTTPSQRLDAATVEREALERALDRIDWPAIHAFQDELRKGQDIYEDAGGFMARAIKALFGIKPTDPVTNYRDAAAALVEALATDPHQHGGKGA